LGSASATTGAASISSVTRRSPRLRTAFLLGQSREAAREQVRAVVDEPEADEEIMYFLEEWTCL
jgi:hypothetical protein